MKKFLVLAAATLIAGCSPTKEIVEIYQGPPLANALGIEGYIYPCGNNFSNDEIFLRLTDGKILALYDGGANQDRLVLLAPGNYITTDTNNQNDTCHFNVSNHARPKVTSASGWPASTGVVQ